MVYLSTLAIAACGLFSVASAAPASLQTRSVKAPVISTCKPGYFALTFDDGPYEYSYKLATTLKEAGIPATFFVNGDNWVNVASDSVQTPDGEKTYEEVLKHVYDSGHQIASHTYQHKDLSPLSASEIREQMQKNEQVIKAAIGKAPAYMRPPEGDYDDEALQVLGQLNYKVIIWDVDSQDWATHNLADEQREYKSVLDKASSSNSGHIALEHEVYEQTVNELVPWAIKYVKSKGYKFATVADCTGAGNAYK